jgi:hypothetical protein
MGELISDGLAIAFVEADDGKVVQTLKGTS